MSLKKICMGAVLVAAMGATTLAEARSKELIEPPRVALVAGTPALTAEQVKQAIIRAGGRNGWTVQADTAGKLSLAYTRSRFEAVVDVAYDTTGFQIRYARSINLGYKQDGGRAVIHPNYNVWVSHLSQSIFYETGGASAPPAPAASAVDE